MLTASNKESDSLAVLRVQETHNKLHRRNGLNPLSVLLAPALMVFLVISACRG